MRYSSGLRREDADSPSTWHTDPYPTPCGKVILALRVSPPRVFAGYLAASTSDGGCICRGSNVYYCWYCCDCCSWKTSFFTVNIGVRALHKSSLSLNRQQWSLSMGSRGDTMHLIHRLRVPSFSLTRLARLSRGWTSPIMLLPP